MKLIVVLFASVFLISCVSVASAPYPSAWTPRSRMSSTCKEVSGTYYDQPLDNISKISAAYWAFGLTRTMLPDKMLIAPRIIRIYFDEANSMGIDYMIQGKIFLSKTIIAENYKCGADAIELTLFEGWGNFGDHYFPSHGHNKNILRLSRAGEYLIADKISSGVQAAADFIPFFYKHEDWYRFDSLSLESP